MSPIPITSNEYVDEAKSRGNIVCDRFKTFLIDFTNDNGEYIYMNEIAKLLNAEKNTVYVNFEDIQSSDETLSTCITSQFFRMSPFLNRAIQLLAMEHSDEYNKQHLSKKEMYCSIYNLPTKCKIRELNGCKIGVLVSICGQIIRTCPVYPELCKGTFTCDDCGTVIKDIEQQFKYTQPTKCSNPQCGNTSKFILDVINSQFVDFQRLKVQETQGQLPRGSIPRTIDVIVRGELVETAQPGDKIEITGTLIVIPDIAMISTPGIRADPGKSMRGSSKCNQENKGFTGLKSLGVRDLTYKLAFLASNITHQNPILTSGLDDSNAPNIIWDTLTQSERLKLKSMWRDPHIAKNLTESLFFNIFGNENIKLGVLLMLFGGVGKRSRNDGTALRGDINVLLVGDPSTAKSQFLKRVEEFSPRSIYTSGKASSAAGLTAAVVKDEESNNFVIEAGALMLADNGVCCIDEFDKMDHKDQVSIHEAMEQQTISITKAGVKATLNARCSILAAANPINGRYNRSKSLRQNINLSSPILSRFDLFFILIDECNEIIDHSIARKILNNHISCVNCSQQKTPYTIEEARLYINFARCFNPKLTKEANETLVSEYKNLRNDDRTCGDFMSWRITVRQLESLIRLSEALARLHCSSKVDKSHVTLAANLLKASISRVIQPDICLNDTYENDVISGREIYSRRSVNFNERFRLTSPKQNLKVTWEKYKKISKVLIDHLSYEEKKYENVTEYEGLRKSDLVEWYLEEISNDLETEAQYNFQKTICEKIIDRLVIDDGVLLRIDRNEFDENPILIVHPNIVLRDD